MTDLDIKTDAQIDRELDDMQERLWGKNPSMNPLCLSDDQLEIMEDAGWTRPKEIDIDIVFLRRLKARYSVERGIKNVAEDIMSGHHDLSIKVEMLDAYKAGKASLADAVKEIKQLKERLKEALEALAIHNNCDDHEEEEDEI